ncbi:MAG: PKD domain-containing protein [Methanomicrobiales archaeon]
MNQKFRITPTIIFCLFFIALFGIATVSAAPPLPMEFQGAVTVNGGIPAPVGSVIAANVNGENRGSITTSVVGQYGGSGNFDPRLIVQATEQDMSAAAVVTFYINGIKADQQENYVAGSSKFLALTIGSPVTQPTTVQPTTQQTTTVPTTSQPTAQPTTQGDQGLPGWPHSFYGMVTVANNLPAPIGTTVQANGPGVLNGITVTGNPVMVNASGAYTGLSVQGTITDGTPITFTINDNPALCYYANAWQSSIPYHSGDVTNLDLKSSYPPTAAFSAVPTQGPPPLTVDFSDQSIGDPTSWNWSFGDNQYSNDRNPRHIYYAIGNYAVTLKVSNNDGTNPLTKTNYILVFNSNGGGGGGGGGGGYIGGGGGGGDAVTKTPTPTPTVTIPPVTSTSITIGSGDGVALVTASPGTTMTSSGGNEISNLTITRIDRSAVPPVPAGATYSFTGIAYDVEPSGAIFDPYVTLSFTLAESDWNSLVNQDLSIKWYNTATSQWEDLQTTVNPSIRTVSAKITHTTVFGLFTNNPPTPVPTTPVPTQPTPTPTPTKAAGILPFLPFNMMTLLMLIVVVIIIVAVILVIFIIRRRNLSGDDDTEPEGSTEPSDEPPDWLDLK